MEEGRTILPRPPSPSAEFSGFLSAASLSSVADSRTNQGTGRNDQTGYRAWPTATHWKPFARLNWETLCYSAESARREKMLGAKSSASHPSRSSIGKPKSHRCSRRLFPFCTLLPARLARANLNCNFRTILFFFLFQ